MSGTEKERMLALLRAMADLLENDERVPVPYVHVNFVIHGAEDAAAVMAAAASALPMRWSGRARTNSQSGKDYYELTAEGHKGSATISAPAADVCTATGEHMVTDWALAPSLAALLAEQSQEES